ncbi:DUF6907 domain-containing protein [Streptomyces xiamenensis]|uniref:DUF6907 domain-containing protein n=1 Tax=Streptomyces xiamenensis TaxID=408015 RepID=UPI003D749733
MSITLASPAFSGDRSPSPAAPVSLGAEILTDADTGRPELVISSGDNVEAGTPEDLRQQIEAAQRQLARLTALADQYEAITATTSPCFSWCNHDGRFPGEHESVAAQLPTPRGMQVAYGELLKAHLYHGDEWGVTQVSVNSQGNGVVLSPAQAAEFADHMESMASQVREMARLASRPRVIWS